MHRTTEDGLVIDQEIEDVEYESGDKRHPDHKPKKDPPPTPQTEEEPDPPPSDPPKDPPEGPGGD